MNVCLNCRKETTNKRFCSKTCSGRYLSRNLLQLWISGTKKIYVQKSPTVRSFILARQNFRCIVCSGKPEWNGSNLSFVLDHIDGNPDNDSCENLRLVCPNCDSQLPTFKSRNKGNGRHNRRLRYQEGKSY